MNHLEHGDAVTAVVLRGTVGDAKAGRTVESEGRRALAMVVRHRGVRCLEGIAKRKKDVRQVRDRYCFDSLRRSYSKGKTSNGLDVELVHQHCIDGNVTILPTPTAPSFTERRHPLPTRGDTTPIGGSGAMNGPEVE